MLKVLASPLSCALATLLLYVEPEQPLGITQLWQLLLANNTLLSAGQRHVHQ